MPWLLAGFVAMLFLVPFDSTELAVKLPFDSKLDRAFLVVLVLFWIAGLVGAGAAAPRFPRNRLAPAILLFLALAALSVALNITTIVGLDELSFAVKKLALLTSYVVFFFLVATVVRPAEVRPFALLIVILASVMAIGTLWEFRFEFNVFYDWADKLIPGATVADKQFGIDSAGRGRVTGPTRHGLAAATLLMQALPFALIGFLGSRDRRRRVLYALAVGLLVAGAFATARKSAFFIPVAVGLTVFAYRPRAAIRLLPLALLLVPFIHFTAPEAMGSIRNQLFPQNGFSNQNSVKGRTEDHDAVKPDIRAHMLVGRGWGTYDPDKYRLLDNQYLGLLIETGFLGAAAFLLIVGTVLWVATPIIRSHDSIRGPPALAAACAAVAVGVAAALFDELAFPQVFYTFLFICGLFVVTAGGPASSVVRTRSRSTPVDRNGPRMSSGPDPALGLRGVGREVGVER